MSTKLLSCVALAATLVLPQGASAGPCGCSCGRYVGPPATPTQSAQPAGVATPHHEGDVPATESAVQPPTAVGQGRMVRRFSYEPGTGTAPQAAATPVYRAAGPALQPTAPAYRPSNATRMGRSVGGLTGEARLHPGRGR